MQANRTVGVGASAEELGGRPNYPTGRVSIAVLPADSYREHHVLLNALQDIFFVSFRPCRREQIGDFRFALLWEAADAIVADARRLGVRCFVFPLGERETATYGPGEVAFTDGPEIDEAMRGQCFAENEPLEIASIAARSGKVLAARSGSPVWIRDERGSSCVDYLAVEPPEIESRRLLREYLHPHSVSRMVPLLHFVREAAGEGDWDSGSRRACFIVDDPSLYRPSYGFVDFAQLAAHARQHGYHAAIATIPLDTWRVHHEVASLFRDYPKQLSLIIHGDNHTYLEMSRDRSTAYYLSILAEALRRFSRLEKQHGLGCPRILEAPHGVISSEAFDPLVRLGYEAALFTPSQFIKWNRNKEWPASLGSSPVDVSSQGLSMTPRLVMSREWRADVSIAAFLRQPIVLAGHHQDFFGGFDVLSELSTRIRGLGNVRWSNLSEISRSRFTSRRAGSSWFVRLGARMVECRVPPGVTQVVIERPWIPGEAELMKVCGVTETGEPLWLTAGAVSDPLPWRLEAGGELRIESPPVVVVNPDAVPHPPRRIWPVIRKILVEARDRSYPFLPEVVRRSQSRNNC